MSSSGRWEPLGPQGSANSDVRVERSSSELPASFTKKSGVTELEAPRPRPSWLATPASAARLPAAPELLEVSGVNVVLAVYSGVWIIRSTAANTAAMNAVPATTFQRRTTGVASSNIEI